MCAYTQYTHFPSKHKQPHVTFPMITHQFGSSVCLCIISIFSNYVGMFTSVALISKWAK